MTTRSNVTKRTEPKSADDKAADEALAIQVEAVNQAFLDGSELTKETIDILVKADKIRETDTDEAAGLKLYCNTRGNPSEPGLERECRGVVFDGDTLILKAFPYPVEPNPNSKPVDGEKTEMETFAETIAPIFDECTFYDSHEGALVRMFNHRNKWYVCTHRKLDADKSKWASKSSFGESFAAGLESEVEVNDGLREALPEGVEGDSLVTRFQTLLDKSKQYMFLIRHNADNRIVCEAPDRPTIYHVGTFVNGELVMTEDVYVPYPTKHTFSCIEELLEAVDNVDPRALQGVIVFAPGNVQYKIQNTYYHDYFRVRGNEPSVPFQYLRLRNNRDDRKLLEYLYPEMIPRFMAYENALYDIAKGILEVYKSKYIHGQTMPYRPIQEFRILNGCHSWHKLSPTQNRVHLQKVIEVMNTQPAPSLNFLIKQREQQRRTMDEAKDKAQLLDRSGTVNSSGSPMLQSHPPPVNITEDILDLGKPEEQEDQHERVMSAVSV